MPILAKTSALFELLRGRSLAEARVVALLSIGDLVLAERCGAVFDRVAGLNGQALHLVGTEAYPWRLRQGKPARHADHIFTHFGEDRRLMNWFVAADKCPKNAI